MGSYVARGSKPSLARACFRGLKGFGHVDLRADPDEERPRISRQAGLREGVQRAQVEIGLRHYGSHPGASVGLENRHPVHDDIGNPRTGRKRLRDFKVETFSPFQRNVSPIRSTK
jgi:hypothetical protein